MGTKSNGRRIQVRISEKLDVLFKEEVNRQNELFGYTSESEVATRLIYKALTMESEGEQHEQLSDLQSS